MRYEDLGVSAIVSAQANSTPLGGCTLSEGVIRAMGEAGRRHVDIDQLWRSAGRYLSRVTGSEDACPIIGAAAGMAIAVAACIAGSDPGRVSALPDAQGAPNEVILQKGHSISYGGAPITQMIALGGGRVVEVGSVNATPLALMESAISERTAAMVFVTSRTHAVHRKEVSLEQMVALGKAHGVPVIVDAAGESDLRRWVGTGADLVIYSGPKMIGAPTSGFVCGTAAMVGACRAQYNGIARPMKVGKENLMGLLQAVEEYVAVSDTERAAAQRRRMDALCERIQHVDGFRAQVVQDDSGRPIFRVRLTFDSTTGPSSAEHVDRALRQGEPSVYLRDFTLSAGQLEIDPRALNTEGEDIVARRIQEVLDEALQREPGDRVGTAR